MASVAGLGFGEAGEDGAVAAADVIHLALAVVEQGPEGVGDVVDLVADSFKSLFDDREGQVDHVGRRYAAVFTGFTETEARSACDAVQATRQTCFVSPR